MGNPFNDSLDWSLRGQYVRVFTNDHRVYEGWLDRIHHQRGSVVLQDARDLTDEVDVGAVFCRTVHTIVQCERHKEIRDVDVDFVMPSPFQTEEVTPKDYHMRLAYRNGFTGSFPVARKLPTDHPRREQNSRFELINGHKRLAAMQRVGLLSHPFEVIRCTDEQSKELYELAHDDDSEEQRENSSFLPDDFADDFDNEEDGE